MARDLIQPAVGFTLVLNRIPRYFLAIYHERLQHLDSNIVRLNIPHVFCLMRVPLTDWTNLRAAILKGVNNTKSKLR